MTDRAPAECWHPSVFIREEMDERDWSMRDLCIRMGGDYGIQRLAMDMYMTVGPDDPALRLGADGAADLALAFGVSPEFFLNLERSWLAYAERRKING